MITASKTTTTTHVRRVVMTDDCNGRKSMSYDWQAALIPSDLVFEASLQMMLATPTIAGRSRKSRRRS